MLREFAYNCLKCYPSTNRGVVRVFNYTPHRWLNERHARCCRGGAILTPQKDVKHPIFYCVVLNCNRKESKAGLYNSR